MQPSPTNELQCPRCGYSQSGVEPATDEFGKRLARCSECGLSFDWDEMVRGLSAPRWLFEYTHWRSAIKSLLVTLGVAAIPWVLFRKLHIEHQMRKWRLVILVMAVLLLLYVAAWLPVCWSVYGDIRRTNASLQRWNASVAPQLLNLSVNGAPIPKNAIAEVEPIGVYEGAIAVMWSFIAPFSDSSIVVRRNASLSTTEQPPVVRFSSGLRSSLPSIFVRQSFTWRGNLAGQPIELGRIMSPHDAWIERSAFVRHTTTLLASVVLSVATFAALPIARRRAKVRWSQIARCAAYLVASAPGWVLIFLVFRMGVPGPFDHWRIGGVDAVLVSRPILGVVMLTWLVTWWYFAAGRYLRMERPLAVALSVSMVGFLAANAVPFMLGS